MSMSERERANDTELMPGPPYRGFFTEATA